MNKCRRLNIFRQPETDTHTDQHTDMNTDYFLPPRTARRIIAALAVYFVLWALLPPVLTASYPLDVVEGIYWGREGEWGYYKHPPLSSWVLYAFARVFGVFGPFVLSQLAVALTLWLVYRLGRAVLGRERALLGTVLLLGVFYYTWPSLEFNHNIAQLPVWAAIIYSLYRALQHDRLRDWLLFGALAGAGMLVKYSVAILLATVVLYSLATHHRRLWLTPRPWLALALAAAVFASNVYWLWAHEWLPFAYAQQRAAEAGGDGGSRWAALGFLGTQLANHAPLLLVLLGCRCWRFSRPHMNEGWVFLLFMGLGPALLATVLGLVSGMGLRDMWGMPMWNLSGLLVAGLLPAARLPQLYPRLLKGMAAWLAAATVLMAAYVQWGGQWRNKPSRTDWPQAALAREVQQVWAQHCSCPLDSVSGDYWLAGMAATAQPHIPSVMIGGNPAYSPWMSAERLAQHGTLVLFEDGDEAVLPLLDTAAAQGGLRVYTGQWALPWQKVPKRDALAVQWRLWVPEHCVKQP